MVKKVIVSIVLVLSVVLFSNCSYAEEKGLVGYWHFNEGSGLIAYDATSNNNDGTLQGLPTWGTVTEDSAVWGYGLSFNGSSNYVILEDDVTMSGTGASISLWFKPSAFGNTLVGKWANRNTYIFLLNSTTITFQTDVVKTKTTFAVPTMSFGEWYHLAITRNSNTTRLYLNGVESSSGGQSQTDVFTVNVLGRYSNDGLWFQGAIDEVRIYNRALTETEIESHYNIRNQVI